MLAILAHVSATAHVHAGTETHSLAWVALFLVCFALPAAVFAVSCEVERVRNRRK